MNVKSPDPRVVENVEVAALARNRALERPFANVASYRTADSKCLSTSDINDRRSRD